MRRNLFILAAQLFGSLAIAGTAHEGFRKLTGAEIRRAFSEFSYEVHFTDRFKPNGTIESISLGKRLTKKWRLKKNALCITDSFGDLCSEVWQKGRAVRLIGGGDIGLDGVIK
jgi:hypothetical protein